MPIFRFVQDLFGLNKVYEVTARRYTMPVNKQPVFANFLIQAPNKYEACREFDTTYSSWTRLDVRER